MVHVEIRDESSLFVKLFRGIQESNNINMLHLVICDLIYHFRYLSPKYCYVLDEIIVRYLLWR